MVNIWSNVENFKSTPLSDLFLKVALDTIDPFPKKEVKNKYIIIAIDHYSKWCEARAVLDHIISTMTKFLRDEIVRCHGAFNSVLRWKMGN
jgi:hypothetical protein